MTTMHPTLRRMSPWKVDGWGRCQQQWWYIHIEGRREPPKAALALGNAFDRCTNNVYERKISNGETAQAKDVRDLMAACWDVEAFAVANWQGHTRDELTDVGTRIAASWRDKCAVHVQPESVQAYVSHEVDDEDGPFIVSGRVDVVGLNPAGKRMVVDHKTSGKAYAHGKLHESSQIPVYTGVLGIDRFEMHVGVTTKKPWVQLLGVNTTPAHFDAWVGRVRKMRRQVDHAIRTGDVLPNRQHMLCSRRWCAFWQECEKAHGGRVKD